MPLPLADLPSILVDDLQLLTREALAPRLATFQAKAQGAQDAETFLKHLGSTGTKVDGVKRNVFTDFLIQRICDPDDRGQSLRLRGGRFILVEELGRGGDGVVYSALGKTGTGSYRFVAVKLITAPASNSTAAKRWQFETNFLCDPSQRNHHGAGHVVKGLESFRDGSQCGLVMEFVEGVTLERYITDFFDSGRVPSVRRILHMADSILQGLKFLHDHQCIHRDIKPRNLLHNRPADRPLDGYDVCIVDLGLAKNQQQQTAVTQQRDLGGTLYYMAPECYGRLSTADARTDLYGLAATLYFMLTGEPPAFALFLAVGGSATRKTQADALVWSESSPDWSRARLADIRREIPVPLSDLIFDTLSVLPADRPANVDEFRQRFDPILQMVVQAGELKLKLRRLRRILWLTISQVVNEIGLIPYPTADNARAFVDSLRRIPDFPDGYQLPEGFYGHREYNRMLREVAERLQAIADRIELDAQALAHSPRLLGTAFNNALLDLQSLLPKLLGVQHLLSHCLANVV